MLEQSINGTVASTPAEEPALGFTSVTQAVTSFAHDSAVGCRLTPWNDRVVAPDTDVVQGRPGLMYDD